MPLYVDKWKTLRHHESLSYAAYDVSYQKDDQVKVLIRQVMSLAFLLQWIIIFCKNPEKGCFGKIRIGDEIEARVTNVREDGSWI